MNKIVKTVFELFMLILILGFTAFGYMRFIEPYTLKEVDVSLNGGPNDLKIAVFSDTHFSDWYTVEEFREAVSKINEKSPDLVFFVGDLIDNYDTYAGDVEEISEALAEINAPLGKFAVYGNHDYGGGAEWEYESIMTSGGFTVLSDEYFVLSDYNICIIGIDDILIGNGSPETAACGSEYCYNIVLCHEPDIVDEVLDYNVNLMIAGHTHGGQVRIPGITEKMLPPYGEKYIKGLYEFNNSSETKLYVSAGLGMTKLPLRFMAYPDISFLTLGR